MNKVSVMGDSLFVEGEWAVPSFVVRYLLLRLCLPLTFLMIAPILEVGGSVRAAFIVTLSEEVTSSYAVDSAGPSGPSQPLPPADIEENQPQDVHTLGKFGTTTSSSSSSTGSSGQSSGPPVGMLSQPEVPSTGQLGYTLRDIPSSFDLLLASGLFRPPRLFGLSV
jgi:hypothetical protein